MDFLVSEGMSEGTLPFSLKIFNKKIWPISTSGERTICILGSKKIRRLGLYLFSILSNVQTRPRHIRDYHFCITFDLEEESYICYAFWVPYEVYIKDFSKFHCFPPVLSSWWFSIHLLELEIQMWRIPPCHTSKVVSWHVDCWYELHLWWSLSKFGLKSQKVSKIDNIAENINFHQFLRL